MGIILKIRGWKSILYTASLKNALINTAEQL